METVPTSAATNECCLIGRTGESDLVNYIETLQGLHKDVFVPRLKVVDVLLAAHYDIPEEDFKYTWKCIFPESSAQKATRHKDFGEYMCRLTETGVVDRESALKELITYGGLSKDAKVGENPNKPTTGDSNVKK